MGVVTAQKSQLSSPLIGKAVDYSEPVQYQSQQWRSHSTGSVENNWRQFSFSRTLSTSSQYDWSSFRVSAYAVDLYGNPLEIWLTLIVDGGNSDGQVLYNRAWSTEPINQQSFTPYAAYGVNVRCYMRFRYPDGGGTNPPTSAEISNARVTIDYLEAVNYSQPQTTAIPSDWTVSTTQTTETTPIVTTTQYFDMSDFSQTGNTIRYYMSTIFGIADSGADITRIMNYIDTKTKYSSAIAAFCLLCGVIVYAMKWE